MKRKVKEIIEKKTSGLITIQENDTIIDAVSLMNKHKIGALLVLNKQKKLKGIISERDILRLYDSDYDKNTKVESVMTKNLIIGIGSDTVEYLLGIMTKNKIRHLPIMEKEKLLGIISIGDLVKIQLEDIEFQNRYLMQYMESG